MYFTHGGELVTRSLAAQGVSTLYTLCGGHIAPIHEGCLNNKITVIYFQYEQADGHAADAHARLTRNIGAALVTPEPGVTDAITAVTNAYKARSPIPLLGGAAPQKTKGMGALQEMPQTEMFQTFSDGNFTIKWTEEIPSGMERAFRAALSGRPGPVFVELPFDVLFNAIDPPDISSKVIIDPVEPDSSAMQQIIKLLRSAQSPLIIAGTQVYRTDAAGTLQDSTNQTGIPVFTNGAGSFGLNGFEFDTTVRFNLPIVSIVGNDAGWGQIPGHQVQMVGEKRAIATTLAPTRYDKVVEALGGYGEHVTYPDQIRSAVTRASARGEATSINVDLNPQGMVKTSASTPYIV